MTQEQAYAVSNQIELMLGEIHGGPYPYASDLNSLASAEQFLLMEVSTAEAYAVALECLVGKENREHPEPLKVSMEALLITADVDAKAVCVLKVLKAFDKTYKAGFESGKDWKDDPSFKPKNTMKVNDRKFAIGYCDGKVSVNPESMPNHKIL